MTDRGSDQKAIRPDRPIDALRVLGARRAQRLDRPSGALGAVAALVTLLVIESVIRSRGT